MKSVWFVAVGALALACEGDPDAIAGGGAGARAGAEPRVGASGGETGNGGSDSGGEAGSGGSDSAGAAGSGASGGEGGDTGATSPCFEATPSEDAQVPECDIPFCAATDKTVPVHEGVSEIENQSRFYHWSITTPDAFVYFSFEEEPGCTTTSFASHFKHIWSNVYFRPDPTEQSEFYYQLSALRDIEEFDSYEVEGGRFKATLNVPISFVWQQVERDDEVEGESCYSGDIGGECSCTYDTFPEFNVTLDFDIAMPWWP